MIETYGQLWSYVLAAVGLTGLYLTGNMKSVGFLVGVAAQGLWIGYAIHTQQWGFIPMSLVYGAMYWRNYHKWERKRSEERERTGEP